MSETMTKSDMRDTNTLPEEAEDNSRRLLPVNAAHFLGITQELLFAYARNPAKKSLGHSRILPCVQEPGRISFHQSDLENFDAYLREPWSERGTKRPDVPDYIEDYLKVECGGQCARCGRGNNLQNAHIDDYAISQSHHHHNLIRICSDCHGQYDAKPRPLISRQEIEVLKESLIDKIRTHLLSDKQPRAKLRIPNPTFPLIGRERDIALLIEALRAHRSVSVEGVGGIGKTQLLLHALHQLTDERPIIWINIEAYRSIRDIETALATALSVPGSRRQASVLLDELEGANVRIAFDGVERLATSDMDDLEDFLQILLGMTTVPQFIFTSQIKLHSLTVDAHIDVGALGDEDSFLILSATGEAAYRDTTGEEEHLRWLGQFCEGHPLSLRLVNGLIRYFGSAALVEERIRHHGVSMLQSPTRNQQTTSTSLRTCLLISYQTLTPEQRRVLWIVSLYPAGCHAQILKGSAYNIVDVNSDIAALRQWHLLDGQTDIFDQVRMQMLSPIRAFVQTEWPLEAPEDTEELYLTFITNVTIQATVLAGKHIQGGNATYGVLRFDQEFPNIMQALHLAQGRASADEECISWVGTIASTLMVYCFVRGLFERGIEIMRLGADSFKQLGRSESASTLLLQLLTLGQRIHNIEVMQSAATEMVILAEASELPFILGNAEVAKGDIALFEGHLDMAAGHFALATSYYEREAAGASASSDLIDEDPHLESNPFGRDFSALNMLAMTLKQRGFVHELDGKPAEALPLYEQALSIMQDTNDEINLGSILHGIGNCSAGIGMNEQAQEAYLLAAWQFYSLGMAEYISNSLSELGHLLVEWDPPTAVSSFITAEMLSAGLYDVSIQIRRVFATELRSFHPRPHIETLRKAMGMLALASFTEHNGLLDAWAQELREDILRPLLNGIPETKWDVAEETLSLMHLDLTLALAGSVSAAQQPTGLGPLPVLEEVGHYAMLCYKFFDVGWRYFHQFEWLSTYLRRHRGVPHIPAEALLIAAEAAEDGVPFSLREHGFS